MIHFRTKTTEGSISGAAVKDKEDLTDGNTVSCCKRAAEESAKCIWFMQTGTKEYRASKYNEG